MKWKKLFCIIISVPENPCSYTYCGEGVRCDASSGVAVCKCDQGYQLDTLTGCFGKSSINLCLYFNGTFTEYCFSLLLVVAFIVQF